MIPLFRLQSGTDYIALTSPLNLFQQELVCLSRPDSRRATVLTAPSGALVNSRDIQITVCRRPGAGNRSTITSTSGRNPLIPIGSLTDQTVLFINYRQTEFLKTTLSESGHGFPPGGSVPQRFLLVSLPAFCRNRTGQNCHPISEKDFFRVS